MKWMLVLMLLPLVAACNDHATTPPDPVNERWVLRSDSVNFAILIVNYDTYAFEGGTLSYYDSCVGCTLDSLPMLIVREPALDFGSILFSYLPTADTLFAATIVWNGQGHIQYPHAFAPPDSFATLTRSVVQPADVERFQCETHFHPEAMVAATDSVWSVINSLDLVHAFASESYRVGYYLYAPTVGMFDSRRAKWVVFLCRGNE
jgi:hypothetical protein